MLYLSAQVSVGDAETADILVLTNTFNGPECKSVPGGIRKYNGVTAYVCRLTVRLTGRVVGRVGAHTGGPPLITMGEGFNGLATTPFLPYTLPKGSDSLHSYYFSFWKGIRDVSEISSDLSGKSKRQGSSYIIIFAFLEVRGHPYSYSSRVVPFNFVCTSSPHK